MLHIMYYLHYIYILYIHIHIYSSTFYLVMAQSQCLLGIRRDGALSTLCCSCRFACQQKMLKTFRVSDFLRYEDGIRIYIYIYRERERIWHFLVNLNLCIERHSYTCL